MTLASSYPQTREASGAGQALRLAALAISGAAVCAAAAALPVIPYGRAVWDFVFVLDGAYRIGLGQVPHVDFASPIGALTLYLTALVQEALPAANPFVGLHAAMWLAMLPALAMLAPRFGSGRSFGAAVLLAAVMVLLPFTVDGTHLSEISYFATYNRFATGLLFLTGLWYVLPKARGDWLLLAYLVGLLFFLKITTAAVAVGIVLAAVVLGRAAWSTAAAALAGLLALLVAVQAGTGMVSAYVADVRAMAAINQGGAAYAFFFAGFRNWAALAAAAALAVVLLLELRHSGRMRWRGLGPLVARADFFITVCLLVAAALAAESQNTGGLGLLAALAVLFHGEAFAGSRGRAVAAAVLAAVLLLPLADIAVKRPLTAFTRERQALDASPIEAILPGTRVPAATAAGAELFARLRTEWLPLARQVSAAGFFLDPDPTTNAPAAQLAWAISAVDAGKVFRDEGLGRLASRYATLAFADPFARMLALQPAPGTTIVIDVGRTVPVMSQRQAERYLAQADGVFVDRCQFVTADGGETAFAAVLGRSFQRHELNACWDFHHRIAAAAGAD